MKNVSNISLENKMGKGGKSKTVRVASSWRGGKARRSKSSQVIKTRTIILYTLSRQNFNCFVLYKIVLCPPGKSDQEVSKGAYPVQSFIKNMVKK